MPQTKISGFADRLNPIKAKLSEVIQSCLVEALGYPPEKRFHRFYPLAAEDFYYPSDRSDRYTIIEISMFEGRSVSAKKKLMQLLFERCEQDCAIAPNDLEILIYEAPKHNWGFRGLPGDEHQLNYNVNV